MRRAWRRPSRQIAIDGKALRGTSNAQNGLTFLNFVSAWCYENGIVLSQIATDAKSNEIKAIPALLDQLMIRGCLVSIDAAGCQKDIVKKITSEYKIFDEFDNTHGRLVRRRVFVAEAPVGFQKMGWNKLSSVVAVETISRRAQNADVQAEWRYYVTSLLAADQNIASHIRNHWSIENNLHWILDVHMGDDANRSHERNSTLAMAALKRVAVNIIKTHDNQTKSVRRKLKQASWDIKHLEKLILKTH